MKSESKFDKLYKTILESVGDPRISDAGRAFAEKLRKKDADRLEHLWPDHPDKYTVWDNVKYDLKPEDLTSKYEATKHMTELIANTCVKNSDFSTWSKVCTVPDAVEILDSKIDEMKARMTPGTKMEKLYVFDPSLKRSSGIGLYYFDVVLGDCEIVKVEGDNITFKFGKVVTGYVTGGPSGKDDELEAEWSEKAGTEQTLPVGLIQDNKFMNETSNTWMTADDTLGT